VMQPRIRFAPSGLLAVTPPAAIKGAVGLNTYELPGTIVGAEGVAASEAAADYGYGQLESSSNPKK
jgi:hypothetical protein